MRTGAFEILDQPMYAKLRITSYQQMDVIGHDLDLDELLPPLVNECSHNRFLPLIYWWHEHPAPILGAEHHMRAAGIGDISTGLDLP
jgi:hypothetical protein